MIFMTKKKKKKIVKKKKKVKKVLKPRKKVKKKLKKVLKPKKRVKKKTSKIKKEKIKKNSKPKSTKKVKNKSRKSIIKSKTKIKKNKQAKTTKESIDKNNIPHSEYIENLLKQIKTITEKENDKSIIKTDEKIEVISPELNIRTEELQSELEKEILSPASEDTPVREEEVETDGTRLLAEIETVSDDLKNNREEEPSDQPSDETPIVRKGPDDDEETNK